jgi:hypothetical protein
MLTFFGIRSKLLRKLSLVIIRAGKPCKRMLLGMDRGRGMPIVKPNTYD